MLYYTEVGLSPYEVPTERALCIYISGCRNHCPNCHYPLLQREDYGFPLNENYKKIVALYQKYATCICFLGEGKNTDDERTEFKDMVAYANGFGLKTCLYSGRNIQPESWMRIFDYIKLGSYVEKLGGLDQKTTNQVLLKKCQEGYADITYLCWER